MSEIELLDSVLVFPTQMKCNWSETDPKMEACSFHLKSRKKSEAVRLRHQMIELLKKKKKKSLLYKGYPVKLRH